MNVVCATVVTVRSVCDGDSPTGYSQVDGQVL